MVDAGDREEPGQAVPAAARVEARVADAVGLVGRGAEFALAVTDPEGDVAPRSGAGPPVSGAADRQRAPGGGEGFIAGEVAPTVGERPPFDRRADRAARFDAAQ